jgi:hypothetical protein
MRRKPKYLDRERRAERSMREFWGGRQWSPTQRKDLAAQMLVAARQDINRICLQGLWPARSANENS